MSSATREYEVRESGGNFYVEKQYACINGLSAWFTVAVVEEKSAEEDGYTDGGFPDAKERAERIAAALNGDGISEAVAEERDRCATICAIHSQYPITTDFDRGYAKARKDAASDIRTRP